MLGVVGLGSTYFRAQIKYIHRLFSQQFPCSATFSPTQTKELFRGFLWSGNHKSKFSLFWQTSFQANSQTQDGLIKFGCKFVLL